MLLAPRSHERLEEFFRQHFGEETLTLPRVRIYAGRFAGRLTKTFNVSAITFGRRVFVAPRLLSRDEGGRWRAPASLVAHEATHVLQYKRAGYVRFLFRYLREYGASWMRQGGGGAARHWAAYRAISFEAQARAAEQAYASRQRARAARASRRGGGSFSTGDRVRRARAVAS